MADERSFGWLKKDVVEELATNSATVLNAKFISTMDTPMYAKASWYNILFLPASDIFQAVGDFYSLTVEEYITAFGKTKYDSAMHWGKLRNDDNRDEGQLMVGDEIRTVYRRLYDSYSGADSDNGILSIARSDESPLGLGVKVKQSDEASVPIMRMERRTFGPNNDEVVYIYHIDGLLTNRRANIDFKRVVMNGYKYLVYPDQDRRRVKIVSLVPGVRIFELTPSYGRMAGGVQGWECNWGSYGAQTGEAIAVFGTELLLVDRIIRDSKANGNRIPDIYYDFDSLLRL